MQLSFQYGDTTVLFDVTYSSRKTISISVEAPGKVRVRAPRGISEDELLHRVQSKARWIVRKLDELKDINIVPVKKLLLNGESFIYLGRDYSLQLITNTSLKKPEIKLDQGMFIVTTPTRNEEVIKREIEAWYRIKAQEYIRERLKYYQPIVGAEPVRVRIKAQQKRWGSCSSIGNLNFNWRAVMAPSPVLDYLIVHELCHLIHHNHSRGFWNLVSSILPDYKERREWLKKNGVYLNI